MNKEEVTASKDWDRVLEGIDKLICFNGYATVVTVPIVIDENVIIVTLSEPSLNDKMYHNLSPYFNKKRGSKMKPSRYPYQNRVHKHDAKVIIDQKGYRVKCRYCKKIFLEVITNED